MIVRGELPANRFDGRHGSRWEIDREAVEAVRLKWLITVEAVDRGAGEVVEQVDQGRPEVVEALRLGRPEGVDQGATAALLAALEAAARADPHWALSGILPRTCRGCPAGGAQVGSGEDGTGTPAWAVPEGSFRKCRFPGRRTRSPAGCGIVGRRGGVAGILSSSSRQP